MGRSIVTAMFILSFVCNSLAQHDTKEQRSTFEANIGYSRYFVDPDVDLKLSGVTGDIRWHFGKKKQDFLSKGLFKVREITLTYSQVFRGRIDVYAFSLSYGRRYEFRRMYLGFGAGPYSFWVLSNNRTDRQSGYTLETGLRFHVYYLLGIKYAISENLALACGIKYNFTVKNVYWHNPFVPHKHEDIFHYFTFGIGLKPLK